MMLLLLRLLLLLLLLVRRGEEERRRPRVWIAHGTKTDRVPLPALSYAQH